LDAYEVVTMETTLEQKYEAIVEFRVQLIRWLGECPPRLIGCVV
jgi:hypothetical protein